MKPKALIITADDVEDSELLYPYYRLQEAGYQVDVAAPQAGEVTGKHGYKIKADLSLSEVKPAKDGGYRVLVIPGGKAPAKLRQIPEALNIARAFAKDGLPVAAVCHGPQVLISAGLMRGRKATSYQSVSPELKEAGAVYQDQEVVVDKPFITSRQPSDLPAFMREVLAELG
jgi:protease I